MEISQLGPLNVNADQQISCGAPTTHRGYGMH